MPIVGQLHLLGGCKLAISEASVFEQSGRHPESLAHCHIPHSEAGRACDSLGKGRWGD